MLVLALVAAVRTRPEPAILSILNGINKVFADDVGRGFGVAVFTQYDLS